MAYWLVKSEPFKYSYDDLIAEKRTMWDGVRNYGARNNMRAMKEGELVLYYHSREGLEIVAVCKVVKEHYPDPTAEKGDWSVVEIEPVKRLNRPVTLKEVKADPVLKEMALAKNSRLSVSPVTDEEFIRVLDLSETTLDDH